MLSPEAVVAPLAILESKHPKGVTIITPPGILITLDMCANCFSLTRTRFICGQRCYLGLQLTIALQQPFAAPAPTHIAHAF